MDLGLEGRHAVVLGASQGLGLASATQLLHEGALVTLCGRSRERLESARAGLPGQFHPRCAIAVADLAAPDAAESIAAAARAFAGPVDILVNNTGGPPPGLASTISTGHMAAHFASMVQPVIALTLELVGAMRERKWGRVLTISSSGVVQPIPHLPVSNALRASLAGFMKSLAGEVAADGVTVNLVLPGRIATGRTQAIDANQAAKTGQPVAAIAQASAASIPAGRYGTPEEFAAVVAFLASAPASYVTGSMVRVDGGAIRGL